MKCLRVWCTECHPWRSPNKDTCIYKEGPNGNFDDFHFTGAVGLGSIPYVNCYPDRKNNAS